jgi:hypothetical protein
VKLSQVLQDALTNGQQQRSIVFFWVCLVLPGRTGYVRDMWELARSNINQYGANALQCGSERAN